MEDLTAGQHDLNKATDWKAWTAADIPENPTEAAPESPPAEAVRENLPDGVEDQTGGLSQTLYW